MVLVREMDVPEGLAVTDGEQIIPARQPTDGFEYLCGHSMSAESGVVQSDIVIIEHYGRKIKVVASNPPGRFDKVDQILVGLCLVEGKVEYVVVPVGVYDHIRYYSSVVLAELVLLQRQSSHLCGYSSCREVVYPYHIATVEQYVIPQSFQLEWPRNLFGFMIQLRAPISNSCVG